MKMKIIPLLIFAAAFVSTAAGQEPRPGYATNQPLDPMASIAADVNSLQRSVRELSTALKQFVDKFDKAGGVTLNDKQQRFIMGLELLVRSEQRVGLLQRAQADLTDKQIQVKTRLTQIDLDLRPASLDRAGMFEGAGAQSVEVRETRREKLTAEQRSLQQLLGQVESSMRENDMALREAQSHVARLRRTLLPEIERAIAETGN